MKLNEFTNTEKIKTSAVCKKDNGNCVLGYARHFAHTIFTKKKENGNKQRYLLPNSRKTTPNHLIETKRKVDETLLYDNEKQYSSNQTSSE